MASGENRTILRHHRGCTHRTDENRAKTECPRVLPFASEPVADEAREIVRVLAVGSRGCAREAMAAPRFAPTGEREATAAYITALEFFLRGALDQHQAETSETGRGFRICDAMLATSAIRSSKISASGDTCRSILLHRSLPRGAMHSENWKRAKDELVDASSRPLNSRINPSDRPDRLFHFTDSAGLVGVLQKRSLRASLAPLLNDPSEIQYGLARARDHIEGYTGPIDQDFVRMVGPLLEIANVPPQYEIELRAYVISFCSRVDRALHWLHYGRSGTGVAIGFETRTVQKRPFDLIKVVYDPAEQHAIIDAVIEATGQYLAHNLPHFTGAERDDLIAVAAQITAARLRAIASLMKHPAFSPEEEWRLITHEVRGERVNREHLVPLPTGYRVVSERIVPFQELVFDRLPVMEIVLGWSAAMEPNDQGLDELLQNTCGKLKISRSSVPVRP